MQWFLATILHGSNIVKFTTLFTDTLHLHTEVALYKRLSWTEDCFKISWWMEGVGGWNKNVLGGKFLKN